MNRRQFISLAVPMALYSSGLLAKDPFAELDAQLDAQFSDVDALLEEQFKIIDEAMEQAYRELAGSVAKSWGKDDVKLPAKKQWVDYSKSFDTRRQFDFERGELVVEKIVVGDENKKKIVTDIKKIVEEAVAETDVSLASKDIALHRAKDIALEKGVVLPVALSVSSSKSEYVIKEVIAQEEIKKISAKVITKTKLSNNKVKVSVRVPFKEGFYSELSKKYIDSVVNYSQRQGVPPSIALAVMQTESAFNPRATSHIPAYGLMQLVPRSGGMDAYRFIYGEKRLLEPDYLYTPEKNIELGCSYLDLVNSRYLKPIQNNDSRWLCTIAAYNTGAGNVSKAFGGRNARQVAHKINAMSTDEVFQYLVENLPYEETQRYVQKVTKARKSYKHLDDIHG